MAKKYSKPRPTIPASIQREVRIEARHSCLVCKERVSLNLHHIDGNRENNVTENIVNICSNCHGMVHDGKITALELRGYKDKAREVDEEIAKMHQTLSYILGSPSISVSSDFGQLKLKYQNKLTDYADKLIFYQSFIFLIPEFYIDNRGESSRSLIRDLLSITEEEERTIIEHLQRLNLVETTGSLLSLKDKADAKVALNELISSGRLDLQKLLEKFLTL